MTKRKKHAVMCDGIDKMVARFERKWAKADWKNQNNSTMIDQKKEQDIEFRLIIEKEFDRRNMSYIWNEAWCQSLFDSMSKLSKEELQNISGRDQTIMTRFFAKSFLRRKYNVPIEGYEFVNSQPLQ